MDREDVAEGAKASADKAPGGFKAALGYALAVVCLGWVLHDIDWRELGGHLADIQWGWVVLALLVDFVNCVFQGLRWHFLLRSVTHISVFKTTQAIYTGMFTNEVLPMRLGELVRAFLVSHWSGVGLFSVLPSMVVERLLDGFWVVLGIGLAAVFVPLPADLLEAEKLLVLVLGAGVLLLAYLVFRLQRPAVAAERGLLGWGPVRLVRTFVQNVADGLRRIGLSSALLGAAGASFVAFSCQILSFWLVMWGYGFHLSVWIGAVVLLVIHLGTLVPNVPANIGLYQFFCVVGLMLFGVEKTQATGFSLVVFVLLTVPIWAIGFLALSQTGMSLADIRARLQTLRIPPRQNGAP